MAGLPGYIQADPSRSAGLLANALMQESKGGLLGGVGTSINSMLEKERIDAERADAKRRADELFAMQKTEHQMKVDDVKQKLLEKEQANKYAGVLGAATSGNVVGLDDQAKLAAIAQDVRLTPEQQAAKMQSVLPTMAKSYEKSPEEQLKIVRASNPLGGLADINPATRAALLKEAEAPMEKAVDRAQASADRREERDAQYKNQLKILNATNALQVAEQRRKEGLEMLYNHKTGTLMSRDELRSTPRTDAGEFMPLKDYIALATATTKKTDRVIPLLYDKATDNWSVVAEGTPGAVTMGEVAAVKLLDGGTSESGSGRSKGKKSEEDSKVLKTITDKYAQFDLFGSGDADTAYKTAEMALAAGIPASILQPRVNKALGKGSGLFSDTAFTPESLNDLKVTSADGKPVVLSDMLSAMAELGVKPTVTDKGLKLDVDYKDLVKTKAYATQNEVASGDPYMQTTTTNKPAVVPPKKPTKGLEMGPTLQSKVLNEYDAVVKAYGSGLYDVPAQQAAKVVQKLKDIRNDLGPTAFEQRYPGVAANYKYFK